MLLGYQRLADEALLIVQDVQLTVAIEKLVSRAGHWVTCARCGEEIMKEREVIRDGIALCLALPAQTPTNFMSAATCVGA